MLKKLKKAFTITELVIVIAVIAILAAVLIPTFSNVINNAKKSAALQTCNNGLKNYLAETLVDSDKDQQGIVFESDGYAYVYLNGALQYIGKTEDLTSLSSDGKSLKNQSSGGTFSTLTALTEGSTNTILKVKYTLSSDSSSTKTNEINIADLAAKDGKLAETLYFYDITVNTTKYAGYFTLENTGTAKYETEGAKYSSLSGIADMTSGSYTFEWNTATTNSTTND